MNILLLSVGTRNKVVQFFRKTFDGKGRVIATDCSRVAPAIYEADEFYITPKISSEGYINVILEICKKEKIKGVLSLIDPELELLALNKEQFDKIGVEILVSPLVATQLAFNKVAMYKFCANHGINTIKTYENIVDFEKARAVGEIDFPVFVKPICGSCSNNIQKVEDIGTLEMLYARYENLMIQELMTGQEIGVDVYIDGISKEVVSIFTKKKLLMRAGETDKAISFKDEKLFKFVKQFVEVAEFLYTIDIDIFEQNGEYLISEVNPRFGGGYPHAYSCNCNFMEMIHNNLSGLINDCKIGDYKEDIIMMKYLEIMIKEKDKTNG